MLQTARISLSDFGERLTNVRGVRLIFDNTERGSIYVANIRLSSISELGKGTYSLPESESALVNQAFLAQEQPTVITDGNRIISIRRVVYASALRSRQSGVEIEVGSNQPFPVRNELPVLRMGEREFLLSRYPDNGDTKRLIFTLTEQDFAQIPSGEELWVQYGRSKSTLRWNFGPINKNRLD